MCCSCFPLALARRQRVVFNPQGPSGGPEYLVAYERDEQLYAWRVDADTGLPVNAEETLLGDVRNNPDSLNIALDAANGVALLVWYDNQSGDADVWGLLLAEDLTLAGPGDLFEIRGSGGDERWPGTSSDGHCRAGGGAITQRRGRRQC